MEREIIGFATSGAKISVVEVPTWKFIFLFSKYSFDLAFVFLEMQFLKLVNSGPKSFLEMQLLKLVNAGPNSGDKIER